MFVDSGASKVVEYIALGSCRRALDLLPGVTCDEEKSSLRAGSWSYCSSCKIDAQDSGGVEWSGRGLARFSVGLA
jgi:hypothetical protein